MCFDIGIGTGKGGKPGAYGYLFFYLGMKLSGMKKVYRYEEDKFLRIVHKMNQSRGFYMPKDKKRFILTILFSVNIIV